MDFNSRLDPLCKILALNLTLCWNFLISEVKISQVTYLIGQFQSRVKFYAGLIFLGWGPGLSTCKLSFNRQSNKNDKSSIYLSYSTLVWVCQFHRIITNVSQIPTQLLNTLTTYLISASWPGSIHIIISLLKSIVRYSHLEMGKSIFYLLQLL